MFFYLLSILAVLLGVSTLVYIFIKNFVNIKALKVETIPKEKESKVINRIMTERLWRNFISLRKALHDFFYPAFIDLGEIIGRFYQQILKMEKDIIIRTKKRKGQFNKREEISQRLIKAAELLEEERSDEAENECISIIEIDPKNIDAYKLLVDVYRGIKDWPKARETAKYLLKLVSRSKEKTDIASIYTDLGLICLEEGKNKSALGNFKSAVKIEPNNPRFLDNLVKVSIILKDKKLAQEAFSSLKNADPDNQKLGELKEQIDEIGSVK